MKKTASRHPATSRTLSTALLALSALLFAGAAFAADVVTQPRPVGAFKSVRLVGSADLVLTQADAPALAVEGERESLQYLKVETRGDELVLTYDKGAHGVWWGSDKRSPRFLLSAKTLDRIVTNGSGDISADAFTVPGDFEISVAGSSDVKFGTLAARKLLVRISGSGDVILSGGVFEQNVRIAGSGDYRSASLQSANATISIAGSGDATLWARDNLSVTIAGSGDVKYYGRPAVSRSITGGGSITGLGDKP